MPAHVSSVFESCMHTLTHMCALCSNCGSYEIVLGDGSLILATPDNEHADIFEALPGTYGTLGICKYHTYLAGTCIFPKQELVMVCTLANMHVQNCILSK